VECGWRVGRSSASATPAASAHVAVGEGLVVPPRVENLKEQVNGLKKFIVRGDMVIMSLIRLVV